MSLTTMQDIGGCRVIVENLKEVDALIARLKKSQMKHKKKEEYNYIKNPKPDGYRSFHLVYSYYSDRNPKYNGLFIEIQIRTHIQHLWATAVETMDTFTGDPLKIGKGDPLNKRFFILASKLLQIYEEHDKNLQSVKNSDELRDFIDYNNQHQILRKLRSIKEAVGYVRTIDSRDQGYYLLTLNRKNNQLEIVPFAKNQLEEATENYDKAEMLRSLDNDVVLVSTSSYNTLKQAYPNYFADITEFISLMDKFLN